MTIPNAQYAGRMRASVLLRAKECGARQSVLDRELQARGYPPKTYNAAETEAYRSGLSEWFAGNMFDQQTAATCSTVKSDPALADLFKPDQPSLGALTHQTTRALNNQPSYCANGSLSLKIALLKGRNDLDALRTQCRVGDTIIIPAQMSGTIASACDFAKPIASA